MKMRYITTVFMTAMAAATLASAPAAFAAAVNPITNTGPDSSTTKNERPGHIAIQVAPQQVSPARSYADLPSPEPFLGN